MKMFLSSTVLFLIATFGNRAVAFNLWCHGACYDPKATIEFHNRASDVSNTWFDAKQALQEANSHIGHGVMAEFERRLGSSTALKSYEFRYVLQGYVRTRIALTELGYAIERLQAMDARCNKVQDFESALARKLADGGFIPGLSEATVRYADAAGLSGDSISKYYGTSAMHAAWQSELDVLVIATDDVIRGLRDAIPLAEKGNFALAMLSGRNALGMKLLQIMDLYSAFDRRYVRSVMASIQAAMEVYPAGYEWLVGK